MCYTANISNNNGQCCIVLLGTAGSIWGGQKVHYVLYGQHQQQQWPVLYYTARNGRQHMGRAEGALCAIRPTSATTMASVVLYC